MEDFKICVCGKKILRGDRGIVGWRSRKYCSNACYNKYRYRKNGNNS